MSILDDDLIDQEILKVHHIYNLDDFKIKHRKNALYFSELVNYATTPIPHDWNIYKMYSTENPKNERYLTLFEYCRKCGFIEAAVLNALMNCSISCIKNSTDFINATKLPYHKIIIKEINNGFEIKFYLEKHMHLHLKLRREI